MLPNAVVLQLRFKLTSVTFWPHPLLHPVFETLGYTLGFALYRSLRSRQVDIVEDDQRWRMIAAAALGALLGSRILGVLEQAPALAMTWRSVLLPNGKTIVGGLLGGWIGVEIMKRVYGIRIRTGDLYVLPLCVGIAIGRVGCFMAGLADDTYGTPTRLPWGVDFGDGIPRHPTQLYEIAFLLILGLALGSYERRPHPAGATFRLFLAAYLGWRLLVDLIKPQPLVYGLNLIQWACVAGLLVLTPDILSAIRVNAKATG